jgi:hypothetical protein
MSHWVDAHGLYLCDHTQYLKMNGRFRPKADIQFGYQLFLSAQSSGASASLFASHSTWIVNGIELFVMYFVVSMHCVT